MKPKSGDSYGGSPKEPVVKDMQRDSYDLSHFSMQVGAIGSLQTFTVIPVVAGDSISVDLGSVFRLSPLRRNLYLDASVDLFAFYIPDRHIYGTDWLSWIQGGIDEGATLGTDTMAAGVSLNCCGTYSQPSVALPRWFTRGYIQIWNRYFRDPSDVAGILAEDYFTTLTAASVNQMFYGLPVAHLKRMWNTALLSTLTTADYRLPLDTGEVNLYDFSALQGRLKTEQQRDYFALRYNDLLTNTWRSSVNIDADKRPELIMRSTTWLSGFDVDATDQAALGSYSGKSVGMARLQFPHKFIPEHGKIWIMGCVRFPPVQFRETHYLLGKAEPTYKQYACDPSIVGREAPITLLASDIFGGGGAVDLGKIPYAQWYREHPSFAHDNYNVSAGHPFLQTVPANRNAAIYIDPDTYDPVFGSLQMKHWNAQAHVSAHVKRFCPDPRASIFAGTGSVGPS